MKAWLAIGISCPGRCWSHHLWKCSRDVWIWHSGMWFRNDYCGAELMVLKVFSNLVDPVLHQNFHTISSNISLSAELRMWELSMELLLRDLALLWDPADLQAHWTLKWTWQCCFYANLLTLLPQIEGQAPRHTWSNMGHAMKPKSCFTSFIQHSHHRSSTCKKGCWGKTKWAHGNAMSQKLLYDYFLGC